MENIITGTKTYSNKPSVEKSRISNAVIRKGFRNILQCPLDIATLDIAAALAIATSTPMELGALALHK